MLSNLSGFSVLNPKKRRAFQEITGTFSVPEISFTSATTSSVVTTITNYDASSSYSVSSSVGTASRSGATVTVSGLSANSGTTITVSATGSTGLQFSTTSASFLSLPATPTLSRSGGTTTTVTITIGNYDAGLTYTIGSTAGSATRSGNTITVTGLTQGQAVTVTATASNASGNSAQGSLATGAVPATPTLSFSSSTETTATFSITNYNAAYTYSVSSSSGSASRSGGTITVTGLAENTSVTAFATATANGVASAQGNASGTTLLGGAYEQIATVTVASNGTVTDIVFSSIPQTYQHLVIRANAGSSAATGSALFTQQNGISTSTYRGAAFTASQSVGGAPLSNSGSFSTSTSTSADIATVQGSTSDLDAVPIQIILFNYSSSEKKSTMARTGYIFSESTQVGFAIFQRGSVAYSITSGVSSIRLWMGLTFLQGTTFSLYGIK